jgi:hypothetical protein
MAASQYQTDTGARDYRSTDEIEIHRWGQLYVVPKFGISARALRVESMPVAMEPGNIMYCCPNTVRHIPHAYTAGEIKLLDE